MEVNTSTWRTERGNKKKVHLLLTLCVYVYIYIHTHNVADYTIYTVADLGLKK